MPANSIDLYHMQDSKNNFNAVRPVPLCDDTSYFTTPCQNIHISTNCYYGYHDSKSIKHVHEYEDCEMKEITNTSPNAQTIDESASQHCNNRKRSAGADDFTYHQNKRQRKEVQTKKTYEPETNEKKRLETRTEELMESLYWNIHGGTIYSCYDNCD